MKCVTDGGESKRASSTPGVAGSEDTKSDGTCDCSCHDCGSVTGIPASGESSSSGRDPSAWAFELGGVLEASFPRWSESGEALPIPV